MATKLADNNPPANNPPSYDDLSDQGDDSSNISISLEPVTNGAPTPSPSSLELSQDGRVNVQFSGAINKLPKSLQAQLQECLDVPLPAYLKDSPEPSQPRVDSIPSLNIVVQVIGSLGDIQPFVALALGLQKRGHRIRIATHPTFRKMVESHGLEFFSIGADPAELMAYMVRNPGLLPKMSSLRRGEVRKQRQTMRDIMRACFRSCYQPSSVPGQSSSKPFVADAIVANPPSLAHIHCAEKLGIPVHIVFT